ncbi:MAG: hypothetical protein DCF15_07670 [Phormidesmis priestleyi]|uniref:M23ase beta-sheet core domain-containing protein n=1 Tax=Phormidesmis priestleyi TaxID=268141 RepID=A0A2W4XJ41_9CYAN|nr:MAG: hypothetical protein DCF15_07670 [Phormidesmis priestleyi]
MTPHSSFKPSEPLSRSSAVRRNEPKQPCRVTVSAPGWHGAKAAALAAGCSSVSDLLEKIGSGELAVIESDAIALDPLHNPTRNPAAQPSVPFFQSPPPLPQHIHIHTATPVDDDTEDALVSSTTSFPKLIITGLCAAMIISALLYIANRLISTNLILDRESIENIITPKTGDIVAGYEVSDEYGIRPFHPVTGEPNVPHNGVDLAMDIGTPIYAVGQVGDPVTVKCWWDDGGGGWVVDQIAKSYPGYTFQSLHTSEKGCQQGAAKAGERIAYSGNSGLGTGVHYDFRVKIDGEYVPPATKYLESAVTGDPPQE